MILDLIKKYRETKTYLKSSQSSRRKLIAIINFFKDCERLNHYPPNASFIIEFTPIIINIFKTSSVNFISPEYFESSKLILTPAKNYYKDEIILNQINITLDYINMHLLKLYFYLGEYEEGLIVLQKMVSGSSYKEVANDNIQSDIRRKKESKSKNVNKYSIVSKDFFKKYRAFEILEEIKYELDRLNSFSSEEINVLLIEDANYNDNKNNFGVIQSFICDIAKGKNQNNIFQFDNITDLDEDTLHNSLGDLQSVLKLLIQKFNKKILPHNILIDLHFNNLSGIYKGSSFLLPAAILSFCNYQKYINNICSFKINSSAAFSSSLDSKGNLVKLPYDSLKIKTHTAFYSWIKYIIIPKENLYDAKDIYKELHLKYPKKELNIIGIENVTDIFGHNEIINIKKDTVYNHTKKFVKRNSTLSLTVFSLFILFLGVFLALKIIPRDIKPLPKPESEMYLIYAPDRDTSWIFKNENLFSGDTIDFGDVAIGDQWYPKIEFWNNSRTTDDFKIEIEGKDKNEFEILWRDEGNQNLAPKLKPDFMQRLYIKYRPLDYNNLGEKNAKLVFSPLSKPENKKTIILKGNSVRYKSGYSVLFDNANKQLVLNNKQNILGDVFSIEFWVKPLRANSEGDYWIFNNADGTNNKFNISISKDSLIYIGIYESKAIDKYNILYSKEKVLYNKWNHFAVIYNKGNVNVLLNGSDFRYYLKNNPIKNIPDRIFIGGTKGPEKRKLEVFNNSGGKFLLNGLTIWGSSLDPEYMLKNKMSRKKEKEDDLILYYDFNEMNFEAVYDLSKNDIWATILGGVNRKMDSPLNIEEKKNIVTGKNRVLKLNEKGTAFSTKNIFSKNTSFTIQVDSKFFLKDTISSKHVFSISHPDNTTDFSIFRNYFYAVYLNSVYNYKVEAKKTFMNNNFWHRYTMCYSFEKDVIKIFCDEKEIISFDSLTKKFDISQWFYGLSFGNGSFFYSPRFMNPETYIDNAKVFNRSISPEEIFSETKNGLTAFWSFEKTDNELAFDEINNLPLIMWEDYAIVNEEISYLKK